MNILFIFIFFNTEFLKFVNLRIYNLFLNQVFLITYKAINLQFYDLLFLIYLE